MDILSRMQDVARDRANAVDVLFSCGEFTAAEVIEHWPDLVRGTLKEPLRQGSLS